MSKQKNQPSTERVKLHRARQKGEAPPKQLAPCGTRAAAKRHVRNDECTAAELKTFCPKCYKAELEHARQQYQKRKNRTGKT